MDAPALGLNEPTDPQVDGSVGRKLYKIDSNGKLRVWWMERQEHRHRVMSGIDGGAITETGWTTCASKGKGKALTTPEEQAQKEVEAEYKHNLKRDYFETPEEAAGPKRFYPPMLAQRWKDTTWEKWTARLKKAGWTPKFEGDTGVYFQPKLDGYRSINQSPANGSMTSREGQPIPTAAHVAAAMAAFFDDEPDGILDGELYNHLLRDDFEKIGSLLKKTKDITPEHLAEVQSKVQLHLYDYPSLGHLPFSERSAALKAKLATIGLWGDVLVCVPTTPVRDEDHMLELFREARDAGHEGGIARLDLPYEEGKRSWTCIKIKEMDDDEFDIVEIIEGNGNYAGYAKSVKCWRKDADRSAGPTKENTFEAGIEGGMIPELEIATILAKGYVIVGLEFFGYTKGGTGVPRQGVAKRWYTEARTL